MNIFCPQCHSSVAVPHGGLRMRCSHCGFESDISAINTSPGTFQYATATDLSGTTVGEYHLESLLGMGGMGVVYKGTHKKTGRTVAIKILNGVSPAETSSGEKDGTPDSQFVRRFEREIAALKRLDHPNIVALRDAGYAAPYHYLVTEYIAGEDLASVMKSNAISPEKSLRILNDVCNALTYAHQNGVVHRDIKPANILVTQTGAKVLDFGLAQVADTGFSATSLTRTDIAMGTFNYLSPEQRMNAKQVDRRTDIFSLGVVFYEMLTGALPLGHFPLPSKSVGGIKRKTDTIVLRCLESDPNKRYQNADALWKDLSSAIAPAKTQWRTPAIIAAATFFLGAVIAVGITAFPFAHSEAKSMKEDATTSQRHAMGKLPVLAAGSSAENFLKTIDARIASGSPLKPIPPVNPTTPKAASPMPELKAKTAGKTESKFYAKKSRKPVRKFRSSKKKPSMSKDDYREMYGIK